MIIDYERRQEEKERGGGSVITPWLLGDGRSCL